MRQKWSEAIKQRVRPLWYKIFPSNKSTYDCPICGYHGIFKDKQIRNEPGKVRTDSKCLGCGSTERHRLMYLILEELKATENFKDKSVLHIAPEECLGNQLKELFGSYESADLFMKGVDHKEDLQKLSFDDASYDWVVISRVLTEPPNLEACLNELRRIVKPGGCAAVAEILTHEATIEFGEVVSQRAREIGVDLIEELKSRFSEVELFQSDRYDARYQLVNNIMLNGEVHDDYPEIIKVEGAGFKDTVMLCRVQ